MARMSARAKVVLPAPRSPERATTSPTASFNAMRSARRTTADSPTSTTCQSCGCIGICCGDILLLEATLREAYRDLGSSSRFAVERHVAAVQVDEALDDGEAEA